MARYTREQRWHTVERTWDTDAMRRMRPVTGHHNQETLRMRYRDCLEEWETGVPSAREGLLLAYLYAQFEAYACYALPLFLWYLHYGPQRSACTVR